MKRFAIVENGIVTNVVKSADALAENWIESADAKKGQIYDGAFSDAPKSADELAKELAEAQRREDIAALKSDNQALALFRMRPDEINSHIDKEFASLTASQRRVLKIYGRALAILAETVVN